MTTLGQGFPGNEVVETAIPDDVRFALSKDYLLHNFRSGESWSMTISRAILAERQRAAKTARSWGETCRKVGQAEGADVAEDIAKCIEEGK